MIGKARTWSRGAFICFTLRLLYNPTDFGRGLIHSLPLERLQFYETSPLALFLNRISKSIFCVESFLWTQQLLKISVGRTCCMGDQLSCTYQLMGRQKVDKKKYIKPTQSLPNIISRTQNTDTHTKNYARQAQHTGNMCYGGFSLW